MSTVFVVGLGYVGLTTAVSMASLGHNVIGYDLDEARVLELQNGVVSIMEPGLEVAMRRLSKAGKIVFQSHLPIELGKIDFVFVCVPTPSGPSGQIVLNNVLSACLSVSEVLKAESILIIKSTLPVGGLQEIVREIDKSGLNVCYNPEFLRQGSALNDFLHPDRIVIGSSSEDLSARVAALYSGVPGEIILTSASSAEVIKLASNAFLGMRLSFANEIAYICEKTGASFAAVSKGMGLDPRIGPGYFTPGPGWGGSCLPKDTSSLEFSANEADASSGLIHSIIESNRISKIRVVDRLRRMLGGSLVNKKVAVWGVSFKAGTDDLRGSPAIDVVEILQREEAQLAIYDPYVKNAEVFEKFFKSSALSAVLGADALVVLSDWNEFKTINPKLVHQAMRSSIVYDSRGVLSSREWEKYVDAFEVVGEAPTKVSLSDF
jgi:UDPglucose 6-dehydrogenase